MKTSNTKRGWKCPLCNVSYIPDGGGRTALCIFTHVFRKDKYFRAISKKIPSLPHKKQKK